MGVVRRVRGGGVRGGVGVRLGVVRRVRGGWKWVRGVCGWKWGLLEG